jgi:hypothetical protein
MDPITLAGAAVSVLSPFLPALTKAGQDAGQKVLEAVAEHGGQAAFDLASGVWKKISARFGGDAEVTNLSNLVASAPADETYQTLLGKALAKRLEAAPDLAKDLETLLGGAQAVQSIAVGNRGLVDNVRLEMAKEGQQTIKGGDEAQVKGVVMRQGFVDPGAP